MFFLDLDSYVKAPLERGEKENTCVVGSAWIRVDGESYDN